MWLNLYLTSFTYVFYLSDYFSSAVRPLLSSACYAGYFAHCYLSGGICLILHKADNCVTGNATSCNFQSVSRRAHCHGYLCDTSRCNISYETFTMADTDLLDGLENNEIIAKVKKFTQDGCGCSHGTKSIQCCRQFSKEAVLSNLKNCLKLSHGEIDLVVLANIQACRKIEITGEKRKRSSQCSFLYGQLLKVLQIKRTLRRTWSC